LWPGYIFSKSVASFGETPERDAAVYATTLPSEYVYTGAGVLVVATAAVVVTGTAVVATATGDATVVVTGMASEVGTTGAAVATGVTADGVVLEVQPANSAETNSSAQTILIVMRVRGSDLFSMVINPIPFWLGADRVKLLPFIFEYVK